MSGTTSKRRAEGTLLGVAPPRSPDAPAERGTPVVVHSGLSPAEALLEAVLPVPSAPPIAPEPEPVAPSLPAPVAASPPRAARSEVPEQDTAVLFKSPVAPTAVAPRPEQDLPSFFEALALRVRSLGVELPLWSLLLPLLVAMLVACALIAFAAGTRRAIATPTALAPAVTAAVTATSTAAAPSPNVDAGAIEAKAPEARTAAEVLALAALAGDKKRDAATRFSQGLLQAPASTQKKATLNELRKLVADPLTAQQTLAAVASLPGQTGPDVLYELWSATPNKTDATELARSLLASQDVRSRASDSLSVALHLRAIEACDDLGPLLERVRQVGDRRSVAPLAKWKRKRVCSAVGQKDCCSTDQGKAIDATIDAVKTRRAPFE